MTGDLARGYHERTIHTWRSVRSGGHEPDWANQPSPGKRYPDLPSLVLPVDLGETDWPAIDALSGEPPPDRRRFDLARLAALLFSTAGVTRRRDRGGRQLAFRAAPSAGALYPVETYVVVRDLDDDLPAGVYHFEPDGFALRRLRDGDHRAELADATAAREVAAAPASVVLTGIPWRSMWKYHLRGYRHLYWDAGAMLANLLAVTTGMAEPARVLAGFVDERVGHLLGVDPDEEVPLAVVPVGGPDPTPAPTGDRPGDLAHRAVPVAAGHGHDPAVFAVHRAGDLADGAAVERWRATMRDLRIGPATPPLPAPLVASYDTVEEVILRRGATRRYARAQVPAAALTWPLAVAGRHVDADFVLPDHTLLSHHVIVHAVEHVPAGVHRWRPEGLELERAGSYRGEATQLCLEQPLGGDSAYTVLHTADLGRILDGAGDRAYRAVLLEGGIALGRIQLAAFTLELGATGLTFYDEDVTRFLGLPAAPICVSSVGVPASRARAGVRPGDASAARRGR